MFYRETPRCFQARAFLLEATLQAPRLGNDREDEYDDSEASAFSSSSLLLLMLLLPLFATCFGTGTTSVFASSRKAASSQERGLTVLLPQQRLLRVVSNWIVRRGSVAALAALAFAFGEASSRAQTPAWPSELLFWDPLFHGSCFV